jgi:Plasmid pRiA4b ORF-3-like protein
MAGKVRLRDVLRPRKTVLDYTYDFGDQWEHRLTVTDVRAGEPGVSYPRYISGEETGRPRIAAAFHASTNGLKRLQTRPTRAMLKPKNGRMNTTQTQSMSCRSNMPSAASRTGATLPRPVSPTRNSSVPPYKQCLVAAGPGHVHTHRAITQSYENPVNRLGMACSF